MSGSQCHFVGNLARVCAVTTQASNVIANAAIRCRRVTLDARPIKREPALTGQGVRTRTVRPQPPRGRIYGVPERECRFPPADASRPERLQPAKNESKPR